jgi:transcriptional regulator with XRE-family HTH domain
VNQIIKNIVEIRKKRGISQEEIAERYGLTQNAIYRLEKGERKLEAELLIFLTQLFEMSANDIINYHLKGDSSIIPGIAEEPTPAYITQSEQINYLKREIKLLNNTIQDKNFIIAGMSNRAEAYEREIEELKKKLELCNKSN